MPQLAKGGKHVFGWSRVGPDGRIRIPPEALEEYGLRGHIAVVLAAGSRTSGGFAVMKPDLMEPSALGIILRKCPDLTDARSEGTFRTWNKRVYARATLHSGWFALPTGDGPDYGYGLSPGDLLLVARGSSVGPSFLSRGPLVEEALRHSELDIFE